MTIYAWEKTFEEGVLLSLDKSAILDLHGELVSMLRKDIAIPNVSRLLAILERAYVGGDLEEFRGPQVEPTQLHSVRVDLHPPDAA